MGRGRYENDNRNPVVTADIKTNSGNVCEYWDASCHVQQGVDSIVENVVQAGENITTWGDEVTVTIQESYVENIETPIVETVENIQEGINETIQGGQDYIDDGVTWIQGGIDEAGENISDAAAATAKAAADAAAAAGEGVTSGINNTLKYGALAAFGIVGVLLVSRK